MLPLLIVILTLHQIERTRTSLLSRVPAVIGVIGALAVTLLQVLLIFKVLSFGQDVEPVILATAVVSVWLILANYLGLAQQTLPSRLAGLGVAVGASEVLYRVMFQILGGSHFYENIGSNYLVLAVTRILFLASYIRFPIWAIWLGHIWSNQQRIVDAKVIYAG